MDNKKLLNLGCGNRYDNSWINIDFTSDNNNVIGHNLLQGVPFENDSIDVVYHSHVLEHFSKQDGYKLIKECHRVLKKGGVLRIVVPDLEVIAKNYLVELNKARQGDIIAKLNYDWTMIELLDQCVRQKTGGEMLEYLKQPKILNEEFVISRIGLEGLNIRNSILKHKVNIQDKNYKPKSILQKIKNTFKLKKNNYTELGKFRLSGEIHQWMYDSYSLSKLLSEIGFSEILVCSAFESKIENWNNFKLDSTNGLIHKPDSLFIEGLKI